MMQKRRVWIRTKENLSSNQGQQNISFFAHLTLENSCQLISRYSRLTSNMFICVFWLFKLLNQQGLEKLVSNFSFFFVTEIKYFQKNLSKWKELLLIQNSHENVVILGNLQRNLFYLYLIFLFGLLFPKTRENTNKEK